MRPQRLLAAPALALVVSISASAAAAPSAKDRADARALVNDGRRAVQQKRWADAVSALKKAAKLDPTPALEVELAQAQIAAGKLVEAQHTLAAVAAGTDAAFPARKAREAAGKALADLKARVPTVKLSVTGPAAGKATMMVDGIEVEGDEIAVNPGDHTIGAEAKGFASAEKDVHLAEGAREEVRLRLTSTSGAAAAGAPEQKTGSRVPGAVVTTIGAAGLVVGGVFGGLAFHATSVAKAECPSGLCPPSAGPDVAHAQMLGNVSTGMFIAGGAVTVVGIALIIAAPGGGKPDEAPKTGAARMSPWVGPGTVGLGASGTF